MLDGQTPVYTKLLFCKQTILILHYMEFISKREKLLISIYMSFGEEMITYPIIICKNTNNYSIIIIARCLLYYCYLIRTCTGFIFELQSGYDRDCSMYTSAHIVLYCNILIYTCLFCLYVSI